MTANRRTAHGHALPRSDQRLSEPLLFGQGGTRPGDVPTPGLWWPTGRHYAQNSAQNFNFDIGQALAWAELLGKDPSGADTRIRAVRRGEGAIKGTLAEDCEKIPGWQVEGRNIYAVPNGGGDTADSIGDCVGLFAEWDHLTLAEQMDLPAQLGLPSPTFSLFTGGKSLHVYWVFEQPIEVARWRPLMQRLINHCGSDPAVKDPSRCMRLPGAWYIRKDGQVGFKSALLDITGDRFTPELFEELLPPLPERPRHIPKSLYRKQPTRTLQDIADALKHIPPRVPGHGNYPVDRNMAWGLKAACSDAGYGMEVARELLEAHSPNGWDPDQILRSGGDQISAGTFWWHAQQHGYRRPADD